VVGLAELRDPQPELLAHRLRDDHLVGSRPVLGAHRPPRRVEPLPPARVEGGGEVQPAQEAEELVPTDDGERRDCTRALGVLDALVVRHPHAPRIQVDLDAQERQYRRRRLLLSRLEAHLGE
jgi:hypothetical protein